MPLLRHVLIFLVAVAGHVGLFYLSRVLLRGASWFQPDLINVPLTVLCGIAPGLALGYLFPKWPFALGALLGLTASSVERFVLPPVHGSGLFYLDSLQSLLPLIVSAALISAVSCAAGAYIRYRSGPNNSFKPMPLRGTA